MPFIAPENNLMFSSEELTVTRTEMRAEIVYLLSLAQPATPATMGRIAEYVPTEAYLNDAQELNDLWWLEFVVAK